MTHTEALNLIEALHQILKEFQLIRDELTYLRATILLNNRAYMQAPVEYLAEMAYTGIPTVTFTHEPNK